MKTRIISGVVMALIVLNTGVLSNLSNESALRSAELNEAMTKYTQIQTEIDYMSSEEFIEGKATEMGMVK